MADFERGAQGLRFPGLFFEKRRGAFVFCHLAIRDGIFYEKRRIFADDCPVFSKKGDNVWHRLFASRRRRPLSHARQRVFGRNDQVSAMGYHADEILDKKDLPKNFCVSRRVLGEKLGRQERCQRAYQGA